MSKPNLPARVIKAGPKKPKRLSVVMRTGIVADNYPTVLSSDPILDLLWNDDRLGEDWIITAPEVRGGGNGPKIVEDATVWFPTEDVAVFFKMLTRGA